MTLAARVLAVSGLLLAAAGANAQCGASFTYNDFSTHTGLSAVGDASFVGSAMRLTPNTDGQAGAVWYTSSQANLAGGFDTTFTFQTGPGGNAADGFAFVIQNESASAVGDGGSGIGYGANGSHGITKSVAVEFDTFYFQGEFVADHVSIQTDGLNENQVDDAYSVGHAILPFDINDNEVHTARVFYDGATMTVYVDNMVTPVLSAPIDLTNINGDSILDPDGCIWVGFTAGTGLATADQDILSWDFTDDIGCRGMNATGFNIVFNTNAGSHVEQIISLSGSFPRTSWWMLNGVQLEDDGRISGSHTNHLIIDPVLPSDSGQIEFHVENPCSGLGTGWTFLVCATADFDGDGDSGTDFDIQAFFACLGGDCCATCFSADFNGDGDSGTDGDIQSFFSVLGGGGCVY